MKYTTLTELFLKNETQHSYTFIMSENIVFHILPEEFRSRVMRILHYLQMKGVHPGNEVVFQIGNLYDFVCLFWACILGKFIAVPYTYLSADRERQKLALVWAKLKNPYMVTEKQNYEKYCEFIQKNELWKVFKNFAERTVCTELMDLADENAEVILPEEDDIAFVQFSSGSTSDPKGVVLTHKNVMASLYGCKERVGMRKDDVVLNWLPLTHNFGLIAAYLIPFLTEAKIVLMQSRIFILNPFLWLKKIQEQQVTITPLPNFGMKHICNIVKLQKNLMLDLSSVRMIVDGSEPISAEVCKKFLHAMEPYGMKDDVLFLGYGLAEATCGVAFPEKKGQIDEIHVLRNRLRIGEAIVESETPNENTISFVELGTGIDCEIKIVDGGGKEVPERVVGVILLRGDNVAERYYIHSEEDVKITDQEGWLDTGDVGFLKDGQLVVTGRKKDIIFVNGENFYSHDIENICNEVNDGNFSRVAVCGVYNYEKQEDQVYCFVEQNKDGLDSSNLTVKLKRHIVLRIGIGITDVILLKSIPITHSGKVNRKILMSIAQNLSRSNNV